MESRRLSRRGSRPLRRLSYAQGLRDAARYGEGFFGRRDRRLVCPQHHLRRQARHRALVRGPTRASCHQVNGEGIKGAVPALAGNELVRAKGPEDVIRVILGGRQATGTYAPMPAMGENLTDQQIADVTDYIRNAWSNAAPVLKETGLVGDIRAQTVSTISGAG